jgi:hypothetical protein
MNFKLFGNDLLVYLHKKYLYAALIILLNILIFNNLVVRSKDYSNRLKVSELFMEKMNSAYSNYVLLPDISLFFNIMNNHRAFKTNTLSSCKFIYLDQDVLFWEKEYNSFVSNTYRLRTNNLKVLFKDLSKRKNVLFILREEREIEYRNYFHRVLDSDLIFYRLNEFNWNGKVYRTLKLSNESTFD